MIELTSIYLYKDDMLLMNKDKDILLFCLMILYLDMKYPALL